MKRPLAIFTFMAFFQCLYAFEPEEDGIFAVFDTSLGEFTAKIAYDAVPLTSANFVGLAEGQIPSFSNETGEPLSLTPFYDGMIFDTVIDGFAINSGDPAPDDDTKNGPGYHIPDEMHPNLTHVIPYVIAMYNDYCFPCESYTQTHNPEFWGIGENSGGSRFYITIEPPEGSSGPDHLDGHYSIFGAIVDGTEVLEAIGDVPVDPTTLRPLEDVTINSVKIVRRGADATAWDIHDYALPIVKDASSTVELSKNDNGSAFQIPATVGEEFFLRQSDDLKTWNSSILSATDTGDDTLSVELTEGERSFLQVQTIQKPALLEDRIPNAVFTMQMPLHPLSSETWTFTFNDNLNDLDRADGFGLITIPNLNDAILTGYQYHELPNGARLRVLTQSQQVITFYLRYSDGNSGGLYAWVDDYLHGSVNQYTGEFEPLRFPATGTFTLTLP